MKKRHATVGLIVLIALLGGLLLWYGEWGRVLYDRRTAGESAETLSPKLEPSKKISDAKEGIQTVKEAPIPKDVPSKPVEESPQLPPSPPLPNVSKEATQPDRKEAFGLKDSVDFVVRKDEPFDVSGEKLTIEELRQRLRLDGKEELILHPIAETNLGSSIRKPILAESSGEAKASAYYAVRVVKPGENLWNIHFAIVEEYLARRHVVIAARSDEPDSSGRSSGIGRLLKFIESVVFVYNLHQARIETDLNIIHPYEIVVFFKITDLFAALDQLHPEDLRALRYVSNHLQVQRPEGPMDLLDRRALQEY